MRPMKFAIHEAMLLTQAEFRCLARGHHAHADVNAARNILRAGLALQEAQQPAEKPLYRSGGVTR